MQPILSPDECIAEIYLERIATGIKRIQACISRRLPATGIIIEAEQRAIRIGNPAKQDLVSGVYSVEAGILDQPSPCRNRFEVDIADGVRLY